MTAVQPLRTARSNRSARPQSADHAAGAAASGARLLPFGPHAGERGIALTALVGHQPELRLAAAPDHLDLRVRGVSLWDPTRADVVRDGDLVFVVGIPATAVAAAAAVDAVAARGAAGVVFRDPVPLGWAESVVRTHSLAIIALEENGEWDTVLTESRWWASCGGAASSHLPVEADLDDVARVVARSTGHTVEIHDADLRLLAAASPHDEADDRFEVAGGGRWLADWLGVASNARRMRDSLGAVLIGSGAHGRLWVAPIRAGHEVIGYLALHTDAPCDPVPGLDEFTSIVATLMLERRRRPIASSDLHSRILRDILVGTSSPELLATVPLTAESSVLLALRGEDGTGTLSRTSVEHLVALRLAARESRSLTACIDGTIFALVPARPEREIEELCRDLVQQVRAQAARPVYCAHGEPIAGPSDLLRTRSEVERVLGVLVQGRDQQVAGVSGRRAEAVLAELRDLVRSRSHLLDGRVQALFASDESRGTDYVATLRAYFDAGCDLARASRSLFVHRNTLRYRLRKIEEVCGLQIEDPDERLVAELQLRLLAAP